MGQFDGFVLELVPHCASVRPDGWTDDHDLRPLTDVGRQQAAEVAAGLGTDVDAIYSSPALRCLQTVAPLARATGKPVTELAELLETRQFAEPSQWTQGIYRHIGASVAGGWTAGRALRALLRMAGQHPRGRVVAASHGDIIPAFLAMACATHDVPLPQVARWGDWYTIRFESGTFTLTTHAR